MCRRKTTARYAYFARKARKKTPSAMQVSSPYPSGCFRAVSVSYPRSDHQGSSSIKLLRKQKIQKTEKDPVQKAQEKITKSTP